MILDGATCRLSELGDERDVLSVLVVWQDGQVKKRMCSWRKARERTTKDETCDTPDDNTYFGAQRCLQIMLGLEPQMCLVSGCPVYTLRVFSGIPSKKPKTPP